MGVPPTHPSPFHQPLPSSPNSLPGTLAPAFERALRRAPDATLGALAALAPGFELGSARASAAFGALLPQLLLLLHLWAVSLCRLLLLVLFA